MSYLDNEIAETRRKRDKCAELYNSLGRFKGTVVNSQSDFEDIKSAQTTCLQGLTSLKNSPIAKKYYNGMTDSLDSFGSKLVGAAFKGLIIKIDLKRTGYHAQGEILDAKLAALHELKEIEESAEAIGL